MANLIIKTSAALFLLTTLGQSAVSAAPTTVTGSTALAVAAVVAQYSPLLSASEKKVVAGLFEGNAKTSYKKKLSISADSVMCKIGNVDITARSCEITFTKGKQHSLKGRAANEVFATLASAGVIAEGAAGSMIQSVKKFSCTLDPAEIKQNSGGGADCSLEAGQ